ncbi:MAG: M55 family metallopeptidase [Fimbriimonadaceae bacterium]
MRVFVSGDIEGCTGIVNWSKAGSPSSKHYDWPFARRMYTHDINAAIRGAKAAGAKHVVVKDSHNYCDNLLVDELEPGSELITGAGNSFDGMMHGIDSSFDCAMLVGYHSMAGTPNGMLDHALVGGLHRFWLNGVEAGEIAVSAACAGAYGVPLVLVSSDQAGCEEASAAIPEVRTYATKTSLGRFIAHLKHPSETGPGIEKAASEAATSYKDIPPYVTEGPVTMRLQFRESHEAELAASLPQVERVDGYTVEWRGADFLEANRLAQVVYDLSIKARVLDG